MHRALLVDRRLKSSTSVRIGLLPSISAYVGHTYEEKKLDVLAWYAAYVPIHFHFLAFSFVRGTGKDSK